MNSNKSKMRCKQGFTLIELLVVVLIIGILAAVAVPQYKKAVERSKATEALSMLSAMVTAGNLYYVANGKSATKFDQLDISIPFTGNTKMISSGISDTKSNADWSFQIQSNQNMFILFAGRITGKYKGAGFLTRLDVAASFKEIQCIERKNKDTILFFDTHLAEGAYCERVIQGKKRNEDDWARYYYLP